MKYKPKPATSRPATTCDTPMTKWVGSTVSKCLVIRITAVPGFATNKKKRF